MTRQDLAAYRAIRRRTRGARLRANLRYNWFPAAIGLGLVAYLGWTVAIGPVYAQDAAGQLIRAAVHLGQDAASRGIAHGRATCGWAICIGATEK